MKKQLQLIIFFILLAPLSGYGQRVGTQFTFDSIVFEFTSENHIKAIDYIGTKTEIHIAKTAKYQDTYYQITAIGRRAFANKGLTRLTFPILQPGFHGVGHWSNASEVVNIEEEAFYGNQLTSMVLPDVLTSIGQRAFANNQLPYLVLPFEVENIEEQAFYQNPNLRLVIIKNENPPMLSTNAFQDPGSSQIDLVVPKDASGDYKDQSKGWTNFKSITEIGEVGSLFIVDDFTYQVTSNNLNYEVSATRNLGPKGVLNIHSVVQDHGKTYIVTAISDGAFRGKELTSVLIPNTVSRIGSNAFNDNPSLRTLVIEATTPPDLVAANAFTDRDQIDVFVPKGTMDTYNQSSYGWTGFKSIADTQLLDWIGVDHITYRITSLHRKRVSIHDYTGPGGVVNIPSTVDHGPHSFRPTQVGLNAFRYANLTEVTIPASVEAIFGQAFDFNPNLTLVTVERDDPPILDGTSFQRPDRDQIDVVVPIGQKQVYLDSGWTDFRSLTYGIFKNDDIKYGITASTEVMLLGFISEASGVEIPETVVDKDQSYSVTSIDGNAFNDNPDLALVKMNHNDAPTLDEGAFQSRDQIDLIVPVGTKDEYLANGWTGFKSITHGIFTNNDIKYEITSPTQVEIVDYTGSAGELVIPETVDGMGETYMVTTIRDDVFNDSPDLTLITVEINDPPTLHGDAFQNPGRNQIDLIVPVGTKDEYLANGWTGFKSISYGIFTDDYIKYGITASAEVEIIEYTGSATAMVIPEMVDDKGQTYTVTAIGTSAFNDNTDLATVKIEVTNPPLLHENAFADRSQIDLEVPMGKRRAYLDNGWTGFRSITETQVLNVQEGDEEFNDFIVHPNPASVKINIDPGSGQELKQVNIYTMAGAYLYSENGSEINTSRLSKGTYLFEVVTKTGDRSIKKVIIR